MISKNDLYVDFLNAKATTSAKVLTEHHSALRETSLKQLYKQVIKKVIAQVQKYIRSSCYAEEVSVGRIQVSENLRSGIEKTIIRNNASNVRSRYATSYFLFGYSLWLTNLLLQCNTKRHRDYIWEAHYIWSIISSNWNIISMLLSSNSVPAQNDFFLNFDFYVLLYDSYIAIVFIFYLTIFDVLSRWISFQDNLYFQTLYIVFLCPHASYIKQFNEI